MLLEPSARGRYKRAVTLARLRATDGSVHVSMSGAQADAGAQTDTRALRTRVPQSTESSNRAYPDIPGPDEKAF